MSLASASPPGSSSLDDVGSDAGAGLCPESRSLGVRVGLITVKALLTADALRRLEGRAYRFCASPECEVVYFDTAADSIFRKRDLRVRVGEKETDDSAPLCYCFDVTLGELRRQMAAEGTTDIPARIAAEVRAGHCACEVRNPRGACCLGSLSRAIESI